MDKTSKNSIKIIIWLVVGESSDNFHFHNFVLCFYFIHFSIGCFPPLPILFSRTPTRPQRTPRDTRTTDWEPLV
jgi:hypothetical protein